MSIIDAARRFATSGAAPRSSRDAVIKIARYSALAGVGVAAMAIPASAFVAVTADNVSDDILSMPMTLVDQPNAQRTTVLASNGQRLAYFYQENRQDIPLKNIAPVMRQSLLAIEDARFREHGPLDLEATLRALVNNAAGGQTQGGSTITQQLVKQTLVSQAETKEQRQAAVGKSAARKIRELKLAIQLEKTLSKDEILEDYLNLAYFGDGAWGISSAASHYFSTSPSKLTPKQSATLAGLVKNPDQYNPVVFPEKALQRRNIVLSVMAREGTISKAEAEKLQAEKLDLKVTKFPNGCVDSVAAFSCDYIRQYLLDDPALGANVEERRANLERGGLTIESNINIGMQKAANAAVKAHVDPTDGVLGSLAMVKPGTGAVFGVAQSRPMGKTKGRTYINFSVPTKYGQANGFQAGSTFKVFTLAAALKKGMPVSTTYTVPHGTTVPSGSYFDCSGGGTSPWQVSNSTTNGTVTMNMYSGTQKSVNTFFAKLEQDVGLCDTVRMAEAMGIVVPQDPDADPPVVFQTPSFTLGTVDVSPLDMAAAYAVPASGGLYCKPQPVKRILDSNGETLKTYKPECKRVLPEGAAAQINDILRGVQEPGGFGYNLGGSGLPVASAAKTGTTNENKAVWYTGYTPEVSTAAMLAGASKSGSSISLVGQRRRGTSIGFGQAGGSGLAAPMWAAAMRPITNPAAPMVPGTAFGSAPAGRPAAPPATQPRRDGGDDRGERRGGERRGGDDD